MVCRGSASVRGSTRPFGYFGRSDDKLLTDIQNVVRNSNGIKVCRGGWCQYIAPPSGNGWEIYTLIGQLYAPSLPLPPLSGTRIQYNLIFTSSLPRPTHRYFLTLLHSWCMQTVSAHLYTPRALYPYTPPPSSFPTHRYSSRSSTNGLRWCMRTVSAHLHAKRC